MMNEQEHSNFEEAQLELVRNVAHELIAFLEAGERITDGWRNQSLGRTIAYQALDRALGDLAATGLVGRENQVASNEFWKIAGRTLEVGSLQLHARSKPFGYAGDFVMLSRIVDNERCEDRLGSLFDDYFQNLDAPRAVRSRVALAGRNLAEHRNRSNRDDYQIAIVGSGPARELDAEWLSLSSELAARTSVALFDLDGEALHDAKRRLDARADAFKSIEITRENLFRLPKRSPDRSSLGEVDFLICLGLFDYLREDEATTMLAHFWGVLRPGGTLLVGNFTPDCSSRTYMEWIGAWYLIYRTRDELARLAIGAGIDSAATRIVPDETGVDLFLIATKQRAERELNPA